MAHVDLARLADDLGDVFRLVYSGRYQVLELPESKGVSWVKTFGEDIGMADQGYLHGLGERVRERQLGPTRENGERCFAREQVKDTNM